MVDLKGVKLKIFNYKSFGEEGGGFDEFKAINVVIGRNNSGKSALIDLIDYTCRNSPDMQAKHNHAGRASYILVTVPVTQHAAKRGYSENQSSSDLGGNHWMVAGRRLVGLPMTITMTKEPRYKSGAEQLGHPFDKANLMGMLHHVAEALGNPFSKKHFRRINAERDVKPEPATTQPEIRPDGSGLTSTIAYFLNRGDQPSWLVENDLLEVLNAVFAPDAVFSNIIVQLVENDHWEVYLIDDDGERIPLSSSGSGLKTVLHLAAYFVLMPHYERKTPGDYVFALEELENNLHPALQRRLFAFVRDWINRNSSMAFMTTHSNVVIDMFAGKEDSVVTHVTRADGVARSRTVATVVQGHDILDDLDVRASDLLQANGLIWLEGPSDRIYFNKWIQLRTSGGLSEGTHYQCVYYGGKLLSHLSGSDPDSVSAELVATLRVNRNSIILIDSDRSTSDGRATGGRINATKLRVKSEFEGVDALAHITEGREIENYLPYACLQRLIGQDAPELGLFADIGDYLETNKGVGEKRAFERDKVGFARAMTDGMSATEIESVPGLMPFLDEAIAEIRRWNDL